ETLSKDWRGSPRCTRRGEVAVYKPLPLPLPAQQGGELPRRNFCPYETLSARLPGQQGEGGCVVCSREGLPFAALPSLLHPGAVLEAALGFRAWVRSCSFEVAR